MENNTKKDFYYLSVFWKSINKEFYLNINNYRQMDLKHEIEAGGTAPLKF
jgi:hypothetical protein